MDYSTLLKNLNERFQQSGLNQQKNCVAANNIFSILNIEHNEVLICRFLGYLLNPTGAHGDGIIPLKTFLEELDVDARFTDDDYKTAVVKLEDHTDNDRRVDIAIYIANEVIPIEVKIYAGDQKAQLFDYYMYYNNVRRISAKRIYYLTPNGKEPSDESLFAMDGKGHLNQRQYGIISFKGTIQNWLNNLPLKNDTNNLITQFKEVIAAMCREYDNRNKLLEMLSLNPDVDHTSEYLELLSVLLANSNLIWENVRKQYLMNAIKLGRLENDFILTDCDSADLEKDPYCLLVLKRKSDGKTVAWICVETNLYVVIDHERNGWKAGNDCNDYFWRYLNPDGSHNAFPLKSPNPFISTRDKISLEDLTF